MLSRRKFIGKTALLAGSFSFLQMFDPLLAETIEHRVGLLGDLSPEDAAKDEEFWAWVREQYTVSANLVNLNTGGVNAQPKVVQDAAIENYRLCNMGPSYYMWKVVEEGREPLREKLAHAAGVDKEEIAINRNSTEGLNTIIFGLNLKAGDEVVLSKYDYPHMMAAFRQREKREGIKLNWVDFDAFPLENDEAIVKAYTDKITAKTKVVLITHLINWMGQILPAKAIADVAHAHGCEVIVDAAQSFNQFDFKIPDTGADYLAVSLHKWMGAPLGSGLLYVKKEKIKNIWPLLGDDHPDSADIRKFEYLGTRNNGSEMAIGNALDFQHAIGIHRKSARLRYLKEYWMNKVKDNPKVKLHTSFNPKYSAGLAAFSIAGWHAGDIHNTLMEKHKVYVTPIVHEKLDCIRISPGIYSTLWELDKLVQGIEELCKMEPPVKNKEK